MDKLFKGFGELNIKYYEDAERNIKELSNINDIKKHTENDLLRLRGIAGTLDCAEQGNDYEICHTGNSLVLQGMQRSTDRLLTELLTTEEINEIKAYIDRPLYERIRWTRGDYIIVFISTVIGMAIEGLNTVWRVRSPLDKNGYVNEWFNKKLHNHQPDCPIDYQGMGFAGPTHRARTSGHDVFRFLDGIRQVADGEFRGVRWHHTTRIDVVTAVNQFGREYPTTDWYVALITLTAHLINDFFSPQSLPLPLTSVVSENCSAEMRAFVFKLYNNGYNLRQILLNSAEVGLSLLVIKIWLWIKHGFKGMEKPEVRLQEYEMRSAVMGTLASVNLAECVVFKNPYLLNIPVLVSSVDSAVRMLRCRLDRNSAILKAGRNLDDILAMYRELLVLDVAEGMYR